MNNPHREKLVDALVTAGCVSVGMAVFIYLLGVAFLLEKGMGW